MSIDILKRIRAKQNNNTSEPWELTGPIDEKLCNVYDWQEDIDKKYPSDLNRPEKKLSQSDWYDFRKKFISHINGEPVCPNSGATNSELFDVMMGGKPELEPDESNTELLELLRRLRSP